MERKVLVKLNYCWADEFDVEALWMTTEKEYNEYIEKLDKCIIDDSIEIYFGTNEYISFGSTEELKESLSIREVSDSFYNEFIYNIGEEYGLISISEILERTVDYLEDERQS